MKSESKVNSRSFCGDNSDIGAIRRAIHEIFKKKTTQQKEDISKDSVESESPLKGRNFKQKTQFR